MKSKVLRAFSFFFWVQERLIEDDFFLRCWSIYCFLNFFLEIVFLKAFDFVSAVSSVKLSFYGWWGNCLKFLLNIKSVSHIKLLSKIHLNHCKESVRILYSQSFRCLPIFHQCFFYKEQSRIQNNIFNSSLLNITNNLTIKYQKVQK